jgi:colanic acid biosynthesis glycosyl transferase WcaI
MFVNPKEPVINKRILLISHNYSPEPTGIGKYNGEMIEWLANKGFDCTVITTFPYYPYWKVQAPYKNRWYKKEVIHYPESNSSITIHRCPSYVPANPTGEKRIVQDFSFWTSMFWKALKFIIGKQKFDLIITVAPPFHLAYLGLMLKKRNGGKLLYHIQDLQIEAAQELNMLSNKKLLDRIYKLEKDILTKADYVSSISEGMISKIKTKTNKEVFFFPNWADTSCFYPLECRNKLKNKWGYLETDVVYLYSGAIGEKQGLEDILLTAELSQTNTNIKFIICGSGPYKEKLIQMAENKRLKNVNFLPVQEKELFNEFLNMADYHLILQKANTGDLVMPSKLTTILAVGGVSIVTTSPGTTLYNLINNHDLGYITAPEDHQSLSGLISKLKPGNDFETKSGNARNYATQYLNIDNVMNDFIAHVFN